MQKDLAKQYSDDDCSVVLPKLTSGDENLLQHILLTDKCVHSKTQQGWACLWRETIDNKDNEHIHTCWLSCTLWEFWFPLPPLYSDSSDVLPMSVDKSAFYRMLVELLFSSLKELPTYIKV